MSGPKGGSEHRAPIIIKKKKRAEGEEHSAAWKIAYADFMTAMMAFFLVMWLTSSLSPDSKKGVSHYFDPIGVSGGASGVGGVLGGKTITVDGPLSEMHATTKINTPLGSDAEEASDLGPYKTPEALEDAKEKEKEAFKSFEKKFQEMIQKNSDLKELVNFVHIETTQEGLRIDLIENYQKPMFDLGSSTLTLEAQKLLEVLADSLKDLPNKIHIVGHTDALAYKGIHHTNWELSSDRASATRRYLNHVLPSLQVGSVTGKADTELYVPEDPESSLNRRISILILSNFQNQTQSPKRDLKKNSELPEEHASASSPSKTPPKKSLPSILDIRNIH
jgi:chemotaxis protein MotB